MKLTLIFILVFGSQTLIAAPCASDNLAEKAEQIDASEPNIKQRALLKNMAKNLKKSQILTCMGAGSELSPKEKAFADENIELSTPTNADVCTSIDLVERHREISAMDINVLQKGKLMSMATHAKQVEVLTCVGTQKTISSDESAFAIAQINSAEKKNLASIRRSRMTLDAKISAPDATPQIIELLTRYRANLDQQARDEVASNRRLRHKVVLQTQR